MLQGAFITGTNTSVGKTFVSALLTKAWNATYWKPFQTGLSDEAGDTYTISSLLDLPSSRIIPPIAALQAPLCPYSAALKENITLEINQDIIQKTLTPYHKESLIIEGAGGLMVPITKELLLIDLIKYFNLPVIIVTNDRLGTLNHTLLTFEALHRRNIDILGFVMNQTHESENLKLIEEISQIPCLFTLPNLSPILPMTMIDYSNSIPSWQDVSKGFLHKKRSAL